MYVQMLLKSLALGAGAMYLFDPILGRRRRALLRDQGVRTLHAASDFLDKAVRDAQHRIEGTLAEVSHVVSDDPANDDVLVERVRSKLGRFVSHPRAIEVSAFDGRIVLSGPVLADEVPSLLRGIRGVRGVRDIENYLETHQPEEHVPVLQGGRPRVGEQFEWMQANWSPAVRLAAGGLGGFWMLNCLARRSPSALCWGTIGFGLLLRSVSNRSVHEMLSTVQPASPTDGRASAGSAPRAVRSPSEAEIG
jgi:hypothetical protein